MAWLEEAKDAIARVHASLPDDISFKDRKRAIQDAYPFGPRKYHPYKQWCKAQREYLKRYDPNTPPPPLFRDLIAKGRDDITFPFAEDASNG